MSDIKVISPDGTPGTVPAEQAQIAQRDGYTIVTPGMEAEQARHEKYGDVGHQALAGVAGLARGATLGLSDFALTKSGAVNPETLKALKEEHPGTSLAAEIGGALAPALLTGGASAPESAGAVAAESGAQVAAALTPAGATSVIGAGVEQGLSKVIANEVAAKLAGSVARGATEAELYQVGNNISEASLGNKQLTAERLLAHSGDALKIGAGLGFGITAGGMAIKAAARKASGVLNNLDTLIQKHFPLSDPETMNAYAEAAAQRTGMSADDVKELFRNPGTAEGQSFREKFGASQFLSPEERDALGREFRESLDDARNAVNTAKKKAFTEMRPEETARLVADANPETASKMAFDLADNLRAQSKMMAGEPALYNAGAAKKLEQLADWYETNLLKVETPEEMFSLINKAKKQIDEKVGQWGRETRSEFLDTKKAILDLRAGFKSALEDESIWGQGAARQASFNDAVSSYMDAEKALMKEFGRKKVSRGGMPEWEFNSKKFNTFISQTGASRSDTATQALQDWLTAAKGLSGQIENTSFNTSHAFDRAGLDSLIEKAKGLASDAEKKMSFESKVRQAARADDIGYNSFTGTAATAIGGVLGGIPGMAAAGGAAKAVNATANPINLARTLAKVEGFALGPAKRMSAFIDQAVARAEGTTTVLRKGVGDVVHAVDDDEDDLSTYKRSRDELSKVASFTMGHASDLQAGFSGLSAHAPNTQQALVNKQMQVAQFLASKLPADPFASVVPNPKNSPWQPSDTQLARFSRYQKAATDPMSILSGAMAGFVSKEGIETINALYPHLFDDFKSKLFDMVATGAKPLPQQSANALSALLGVPLSPMMQPQLVQQLQANFSKKDNDDGQKMPRTTKRESKYASDLKTDSQRHSGH